MSGIAYQFLPWARRGLARAHQSLDGQDNLPARPQVKVGLTLQARQDGQGAAAVSGNIDLSIYGPGDVIGIDPRLVVRTDPKPHISNFEPNYLAVIDFDPPDFPWMMTPAKAGANQRLSPWLALIVLQRSASTLPQLRPGTPLPVVALSVEQVGSELPNLADAALWAHAQAVTTGIADDTSRLSEELSKYPERNISRLVCPRRLQPNTAYVACVVPVFEVGRLRGLGQPVAADAVLSPAWDQAAPVATELPVYYHWEFATGPQGDIEALARRIKTPDKYKTDKELLAQLDHIGELPVAVDGDHLLFKGVQPGQTLFEGALVSLDFKPTTATGDVKDLLADMLNSGQALAAAGTAKSPKVPTLSPPIYGEHPANRHVVKSNQVNTRWLDQLNLQPRYRLAAGWGAEVVRRYQDEFMQAAWEQVGEVLAAERAFSLSRLSRDVLKAIERRHLAKLPDHRLMALLAPARARLKLAPQESLYGRIEAATLPAELFDGAMRRFTAPTRPTLRMALWRERDLGRANVAAQMGQLVALFSHASSQVAQIDPNQFVPDGLLGSRSFDNITLPDDLSQAVDLFKLMGLEGSLTGHEILQIRQSAEKLRKQAAQSQPATPKMGDVWHKGILTETHLIRLAELQRAAGRHLDAAELGQLVQQVSKRGTEGVLLSVSETGQVSAQGLKIDGRNGNLKRLGAAVGGIGVRGGPVGAGQRIAAGALGAVPVRALRQYGNSAVFTSLPGGVLGQGTAAVQLQLDAPGRFAPSVGLPAVPAQPTITLPPATKSRVVVGRYAQAFKEFHKAAVDPLVAAQVSIVPVDFAMAQATAQARSRINPEHTVPTRLASTLSLGGQTMTWDADAGLANSFLSTRLDLAFLPSMRYVVPRQWDRVMAFPHLAMPLARKLEVLAPEVFLPGVGVLPDDFIMVVKTNPRFVEALMVGANHEMGREFLWQGFPTDQRGTPFRHFWQRLDGKVDIDFIHAWQQQALGQQPGSAEMLVLLIRGQLLERFPNLSIYAYPKSAGDTRPGASGPKDQNNKNEMDPEKMEWPVLHGHLGTDITYVGFSPAIKADEANMQNWYFILEEHMTEPRFGFDEPGGPVQNRKGWLDVDWDEVGVLPGDCFTGAKLRLAPPAQGLGQVPWANPHAAMVAQALLQRPFRGYYVGSKLVPPKVMP
jgi:hypothetical protein